MLANVNNGPVKLTKRSGKLKNTFELVPVDWSGQKTYKVKCKEVVLKQTKLLYIAGISRVKQIIVGITHSMAIAELMEISDKLPIFSL